MPTQNHSDIRVVVGGRTITGAGKKIGTAYTTTTSDPNGSIIGQIVDWAFDLIDRNLVVDLDDRDIRLEKKSKKGDANV